MTEPTNGRAAGPAPNAVPRPEFVDAFQRAMTAGGGKAEDIARFVGPLAIAARRYRIDTRFRVAHFVAQIGHESGGFARVEENLNYSADRLREKFPKRFVTGKYQAEVYARRPEALANLLYAGVNGNGDEASGDGWRWRGRSPIQLTGRENYRLAAKGTGLKLLDDPDLAIDPYNGALIAGWFWDDRALNERADIGEAGIEAVTKRVNGKYMLGLEDRAARYRRAIAALASFPDQLEA